MLDAMILIAATAIGFGSTVAITRDMGGAEFGLDHELWDALRRVLSRGSTTVERFEVLCELMMVYLPLALPLALSWALALIPIRLLSPRPRFRQLTCQPGFMAALAVAFMIVSLTGLLIVPVVLLGSPDAALMLWAMVLEFGFLVGPFLLAIAVSVSWMTLVVGRRWRAEASWIDRLGRACGAFLIFSGLAIPTSWIVMTLAEYAQSASGGAGVSATAGP
jgi:hypothetical protein